MPALNVDRRTWLAVKAAASERGETIARWVTRAVRNQLLDEYRQRRGFGPDTNPRTVCRTRGCHNPADTDDRLCQPCDTPRTDAA